MDDNDTLSLNDVEGLVEEIQSKHFPEFLETTCDSGMPIDVWMAVTRLFTKLRRVLVGASKAEGQRMAQRILEDCVEDCNKTNINLAAWCQGLGLN